MQHPTPEILNQLFSYDPNTGELTRKTTGRPVYLENKGNAPHVVFSAKRILAKRIIVAMQTGEWQDGVDIVLLNMDSWDTRYVNIYVLSEGEKRCSGCHGIKPLCDFHNISRANIGRARAGKHNYCIGCSVLRERISTQEAKTSAHRYALKAKYNMTMDDYNQMLGAQGSKCKICGVDVGGVRYRKLVVDHCHTTGGVRGLLCPMCNAGLGMFKDDPKRMLIAAKYLLKI